jgi:glycosyltransferase involved in cell wall biosynthesis
MTWMGPFMSGGGYANEARTFYKGLHALTEINEKTGANNILSIPAHHGDIRDLIAFRGLDKDFRYLLLDEGVFSTSSPNYHRMLQSDVIICHAVPVLGGCPPANMSKIAKVVVRTMFETDTTPEHWLDALNAADAVWVPTEFQRQIFLKDGVNSTIYVVPEPVDVDFFKPARRLNYWLPTAVDDVRFGLDAGEVAFSSEPAAKEKLVVKRATTKAELDLLGEEFRFLTVGKWEQRKGFQYLLEAYLTEFSADENVVLHMLTHQFHNDSVKQTMTEKVQEVVQGLNLALDVESLPAVRVIQQAINVNEMPNLYSSVDTLVSASRGEGWGRPLVEAMSCELPVIATFWSGPSGFMTEENSYPLRHTALDLVDNLEMYGAKENFHRWATPDVQHLRQLMRHVYTHREEAKRKGKQARQDMVEKFCPTCVAKLVHETIWDMIPFEEENIEEDIVTIVQD